VDLRSQNIRKTITSKGLLLLRGARVSTVGLGVMLAVILLGLAAATALPTPAVAQNEPADLEQLGSVLAQGVSPNLRVLEGPPYLVPVTTRRWEDRSKTFVTWSESCTTEPQVRIERRSGRDPSFQLVWQGALLNQPRTEYLRIQTLHEYRLVAQCQKPSGLSIGTMQSAPFVIQVVEDDKLPPEPGTVWAPTIGYLGNWVTKSSGFPSGDSTHEARQDGAAAILPYYGIAAAWVSTLDDSPTLARVVCDERRDPQGGWIPCAEVETEDPDPGISGRSRRVVWASRWDDQSTSRRHEVRVISNESHDVDVDAFVTVTRVGPF
jgi:hypothetical protein